MKREYDYLIVGSGLFGAVFAHEAHKSGKRCLVIDKRTHIGGNVYCSSIEGINVHEYGAHIFHTSNREVWDYVNGIVPFNRYTNSPIAVAPDGRLYNLPFNMNTFCRMWGVTTPAEAQDILDEQRMAVAQKMRSEGVGEPRNLEEQALSLVGQDVYELLIKGYTEKQWGRPCNELPAFIIRRLPVRLTYDNNYFNDLYQGIPVGGYNQLISGLLNGVEVRLGVDYFDNRQHWNQVATKIVFTGKIDEYFDYQFGNLEYRTVRFETELLPVANYQGNAVVNYTSADVPYTRIIEHKHFEALRQEDVYAKDVSVISREYSTEWRQGLEPFYPVNDVRNQAIYAKYKALAEAETNTIFGGRLAEYKYYDMAPIIACAIGAYNQDISK